MHRTSVSFASNAESNWSRCVNGAITSRRQRCPTPHPHPHSRRLSKPRSAHLAPHKRQPCCALVRTCARSAQRRTIYQNWHNWHWRCTMEASRWTTEQVFIYRHPVDMRKGAAGLCAIVSLELGRDPADRSLYVFINRSRNQVKLLVWHLNGYWVLYKSLEKQRFHWPDWFEDDCITLLDQQGRLQGYRSSYRCGDIDPALWLSTESEPAFSRAVY